MIIATWSNNNVLKGSQEGVIHIAQECLEKYWRLAF